MIMLNTIIYLHYKYAEYRDYEYKNLEDFRKLEDSNEMVSEYEL